MEQMTLISVDHVTYGYSRQPALKDISVDFHKGEIVSLLGPNGSGKTTLLKLLLGLHHPQEGRVLFEGRPVCDIPPKQMSKRVAYVPQFHRLSFGYRVLDVVLMGRMPHKPFFFRFCNDDEKASLEALERLSIAHLKDRPYTEMSGGERQLTLVARALAQGADIFIMDEPVNGLDYGNQIRLLSRITDLAHHGYTFIKTTHFPDHALWFSDRVVMLKDGKVIADGDASQMVNRLNLYNLYNTHIAVMDLDGGGHICVPEGVTERRGHCAVNGRFNVQGLRA